ncbi:MAG: class I SAM-dependent methyltransferase [Bacilli bacterium]|nr:class I SAM-dependent methyltransferase [Bacilli bacterium]
MEIVSRIDEYLSKDFCDPDFFQLYSFATENINGYMQFFDLKNKSLLTVGSSSDQTINAILAGSSSITVCDICPLTKYFYYLKLASLLVLSREDFLNFLCKRQSDIEGGRYLLSKSTFERVQSVLKLLDYESYYIWEYLFSNYSKEDIEKLFRRDVNDLDSIIYCNRYLKNDYNYNRAREIVMSVSVDFVIEDITKLSIDRFFDNIWLSNVAHYLYGQGIDDMIKNSSRMLNDNGRILVCYFWNTSMTVKGFPIEHLSSIEAEQIRIPGISKMDDKNSILVYTKG